jgi:hypothetical protein
MDVVGNRRHNVPLPFNYLNSDEWKQVFAACNLSPVETDSLDGLYPFPARFVFGRRLNFMAMLQANSPKA